MSQVETCHCGEVCGIQQDDEPCYGEVSPVDESTEDDWIWSHRCEGHYGKWGYGPYTPKVE